MSRNPKIEPKVVRAYQKYFDRAVELRPKVSQIGREVGRMMGNGMPRPITVGYDRVRLEWMVPDGKGGLKPKEG